MCMSWETDQGIITSELLFDMSVGENPIIPGVADLPGVFQDLLMCTRTIPKTSLHCFQETVNALSFSAETLVSEPCIRNFCSMQGGC